MKKEFLSYCTILVFLTSNIVSAQTPVKRTFVDASAFKLAPPSVIIERAPHPVEKTEPQNAALYDLVDAYQNAKALAARAMARKPKAYNVARQLANQADDYLLKAQTKLSTLLKLVGKDKLDRDLNQLINKTTENIAQELNTLSSTIIDLRLTPKAPVATLIHVYELNNAYKQAKELVNKAFAARSRSAALQLADQADEIIVRAQVKLRALLSLGTKEKIDADLKRLMNTASEDIALELNDLSSRLLEIKLKPAAQR